MSSALGLIRKDSRESETAGGGLSLFDQLKNSKDHNCVNKVATVKAPAQISDDKPKIEPDKGDVKIDNTIAISETIAKLSPSTSSSSSSYTSTTSSSSSVTTKEKPEFYPPFLPAATTQNMAGGIGMVHATKRGVAAAGNLNQNLSKANLFGLRPSLPLQSLKRSQQHSSHVQHATKKTIFSSTKSIGNFHSAASSLASATTITTTTTSSLSSSSAAVFKAGDQTHHQQNHKKKRCTDRYDSSESSDRYVL